MPINRRKEIIPSERRIGEVFEDLATEIADELLYETFIDLNPSITRLNNINSENSNYERNRRAEES